MAASIASSDAADRGGVAGGPTRVLCLGNELISDDGVGPAAARLLGERLALAGRSAQPMASIDPAVTMRTFELSRIGRVELVETALTGMYLLDSVVGASRLIVVDSVVTGGTDPGTVLELRECDLDGPRGTSPHYIGLLETLDLARALDLDVPADVVVVAVEAGDYWTVGGKMTDRVRAAVSTVVDRTMALVEDGATLQAATLPIGDTSP